MLNLHEIVGSYTYFISKIQFFVVSIIGEEGTDSGSSPTENSNNEMNLDSIAWMNNYGFMGGLIRDDLRSALRVSLKAAATSSNNTYSVLPGNAPP